jgi:hypothetical protein
MALLFEIHICTGVYGKFYILTNMPLAHAKHPGNSRFLAMSSSGAAAGAGGGIPARSGSGVGRGTGVGWPRGAPGPVSALGWGSGTTDGVARRRRPR